MKNLAMMFILILAISCIDQNTDKGNLIASNPFLIGKWTGEGIFFDMDINKEVGPIKIEIEIKEDNSILGKIGEAQLINTNIAEAKYGFDIKGELDSELKKGTDLNKDHLIILFVIPEENRQDVTKSDSNFHLKSNYTFDFSMRVGGVILTKDL
jgi:hypothetical protein